MNRATRNRRPAYVGAPPRTRQSEIEKPFMPLDYPMSEPGLLKRLFGRGG